MTDTLPNLLERRTHRLTLNLTRVEADQITKLAVAMGVLNRASVARALVIEGLQRHVARYVATGC